MDASPTLWALTLTAAGLGVMHTLTGPDHYVPFIAMSRVGRWSPAKTLVVTLLCGVGHVAGSVLLGAIGIALGWALGGMKAFEAGRGGLAGWLLIAFGVTYLAWGIKRAIRRKPHTHVHVHEDGTIHNHEHGHTAGHLHVHADDAKASMTPWVLFAIFVFGPCEPLIPLLMYPAVLHSTAGVIWVTLVFAACTLVTMSAVVLVGVSGMALASERIPFEQTRLARYSHALAGLAITACGVAVKMGL
jgi:sulfite exporter TauE/SafE